MLVIQNRKIKKGIEIPEIETTVSLNEKSVTFSAIDKEKYADWLALNTSVNPPTKTILLVFTDVNESKYYKTAQYDCNELTVSGDAPEDVLIAFSIEYGLFREI